MTRPHADQPDPRRTVPRTDALLAAPAVVAAVARLGASRVKRAVTQAQQQVREGRLAPQDTVAAVLDALPVRASSLTPVINATGVVLHTNLGRAPLSPAAIAALESASGYVDVEFDLVEGRRARRGAAVLEALVDALVAALPDEVDATVHEGLSTAGTTPRSVDALVVNNGAAALVLATTALAQGREILVSRGELVEIGDGFRLPDLIASTGARIREVGTTNRTTDRDYLDAIDTNTAAILKVHPSNFRIEGFTAGVETSRLAELGLPVIVDIGSGLLTPDPVLPAEPDVATTLRAGATIVTCSGDKLLGGPQAGLLLGAAEYIARLRRHPLARALRVDKLTLAALEATLTGPVPPTVQYLHRDPAELRRRCEALVEVVSMSSAGGIVGAEVVPADGAVGGGGAPGVLLPGWAVSLPQAIADPLRRGDPAVVGRLERGRCLIDLRCVAVEDDDRLAKAIRAALEATATATAATATGTASSCM
ncbi:L-seryl-tRNA(Sec) selenium transferase [Jatrophihabitans telluris]|uniref:L-seryl-tRNA(Sec) selenium transferase n=1 Tax=Jatrophihabitans telluris TaxID=2038343 RepID=A0ABY4QTD5_9ACTN|nr:L-seryl-tRNA(Sec) selenium transferase [Jatrophihabitans telluris]UQX86928.1 L-seryl-tRNA(Sec) selenium transferase [Jatrophihabitans telluris]